MPNEIQTSAFLRLSATRQDDIHASVMNNPDLEIVTDAGGARRTSNTIATTDVLRLKPQRSFFPMFLNSQTDPKKR